MANVGFRLMPSSASVRKQIESALEHRYPSVLTPSARTIREVASTGIAQVDELLNGGLPIGAISELTGPLSSGKTSIAIAALSRRIYEGGVCAWVDVNDAFDPESAAANGISLNQLLWVRCSASQATNQPDKFRTKNFKQSQPWTRLDQALRATDLLLQSGGFSSVVLDLSDECIEHGRRIPLATWFRYRQAADRTRCSLIVLGKAPYAESSAAVVLECEQAAIDSANHSVICRFNYKVHRHRERFSPITSIDRKPPASTWSARALWNTEKRA
jgi:hypothetical protein